ncbi:MAG: hypothetical protein K2M56_01060 [Muribaculaceae bacterium]|nr:hypothetical protein [Muribaculaceae bacterium]
MNLIIDGKKAVIKAGSSFEYVSENRAFTDSDAYTLAITLPMAGCPQNQSIFGYMERMDFNSRDIVLDASIIDGDFCKSGVISVVEATESEIKVQFLEGRSVQNFLIDYDKIYINELDLGSYPVTLPASPSYPTYDAGANYLPFQWVNDSAEGFLNNEIFGLSAYAWAESTETEGKLSYMPYLIFIAKKICEATEFSYDFSPWENSEDRFLLLCNTIPAAWGTPAISRALPHWSFPEFFAQLERFLICEFDIDYKRKSISMKYSKDVDSLHNIIKIDDVVDDFNSDISYKDSLCKYRTASRIYFTDRGDSEWKFNSCSWFIELMKKDPAHFHSFNTTEEYNAWYNQNRNNFGGTTHDAERGPNRGRLYHIKETDRYFIFYVVPANSRYLNGGQPMAECYYRSMSINMFSDYVYDLESEETIELKIVPARTVYLSWSRGFAVCLSPAQYNEAEDVDEDDIRQPYGYSLLNRGNGGDKSPEYYDKLLVAIWDGNGLHTYQPCPTVDQRLSLKERYKSYQNGILIKPKEKIKLKFLSDHIPDVRSVFHIRGRRYLCEKITATFSENGMSQLMKGDFYPVDD